LGYILNIINIEGFTFKLAGDFFINPIKSPKKYKWGDNQKTFDHITTSINFMEDGADQKTEQAYVVTVDREVVYVGEFSGTLRERWLKVDNYIWHNKDHLIYKAILNGKNVSLWLIVDPCIKISSGLEINICKSIEHHILKNNNLLWNQRNNKSLTS
jgi:hypothetical protein